MIEARNFEVSLGNEDSMKASVVVSAVVVVDPEVQWLEKMGVVVTNWKEQTMRFNHEGRMVTMKGDSSLTRSCISLRVMIRTIRRERGGILVELRQMERQPTEGVQEEVRQKIPAYLEKVMRQY